MTVILMMFIFQAEVGIRDLIVTGVQTCALPILILFVVAGALAGVWYFALRENVAEQPVAKRPVGSAGSAAVIEIGRASCRGKSVDLGGRRIIKKKKKHCITGMNQSNNRQQSATA